MHIYLYIYKYIVVFRSKISCLCVFRIVCVYKFLRVRIRNPCVAIGCLCTRVLCYTSAIAGMHKYIERSFKRGVVWSYLSPGLTSCCSKTDFTLHTQLTLVTRTRSRLCVSLSKATDNKLKKKKPHQSQFGKCLKVCFQPSNRFHFVL